MRRVVVTGMGMVTPLGCSVETTWQRLLKGESGAKQIDTFDVSDISCKIAGVVPRGVHDHYAPLLTRFSSRSCESCGNSLALPLDPGELVRVVQRAEVGLGHVQPAGRGGAGLLG